MNTPRIVSAVMVFVMTTVPVFAQAPVYTGEVTQGMASKMINKGQTTQAEILQLFGSPNITTISKKGEEVWTYDRISYNSTTQGGANTQTILLGGAAGATIGAIVGHQSKNTGKGALLGGVVGAIAGYLFGHKNPEYQAGSKTAMLMLWFDDNDVVRDYSVTSTQF